MNCPKEWKETYISISSFFSPRNSLMANVSPSLKGFGPRNVSEHARALDPFPPQPWPQFRFKSTPWQYLGRVGKSQILSFPFRIKVETSDHLWATNYLLVGAQPFMYNLFTVTFQTCFSNYRQPNSSKTLPLLKGFESDSEGFYSQHEGFQGQSDGRSNSIQKHL